jgi:predicted Fe-Mo cluster-binding NifX family protein
MLIWIPVDGNDAKTSKVVPQYEAKQWALVDFDEGEAKSVRFFETREACDEAWVDFAILINKYENYMDFMNEGMMVLCVREEETIEDIIEAFKFKELDEIGL